MPPPQTAAVKLFYGVLWHERDAVPVNGRLAVGPHGVLLSSPGDEGADECELPFDQIEALELRPAETKGSRSKLTFELNDGRQILVESMVDKWIVADVLEGLFTHTLGEEQNRRFLVAVELRPACRSAARELLASGPPFDPTTTTLVSHDVFLLDDEALFLFETDENANLDHLVHPDFWDATGAWRNLMTGAVRLTEHAYSWSREASTPIRDLHAGLGF